MIGIIVDIYAKNFKPEFQTLIHSHCTEIWGCLSQLWAWSRPHRVLRVQQTAMPPPWPLASSTTDPASSLLSVTRIKLRRAFRNMGLIKYLSDVSTCVLKEHSLSYWKLSNARDYYNIMCEGEILSTIRFQKRKAAAKCSQSRKITCGDNCTGCNPDELAANMINQNSEPGKDVLCSQNNKT